MNKRQCDNCIHLPICKLASTYNAAQEAVNQAYFSETELDERGQKVSKLTYVVNLRDWLTIPMLECKYYELKYEVTVK